MKRKKIEAMVKDIIGEADYDLWKQLDPVTAEEPREAKGFLKSLVAIVRKHLEGDES